MDNNDLLGRIKTQEMYQPFLMKLNELVNNLAEKGYRFYAICGYRSPEEQARIYAYGRTDMSAGIRTNAKPYSSVHQYSCAVDFCLDIDLDKPGLQPKWEDNKAYEKLALEAEKLGLEAGAHWKSIKDQPHVQLPLSSKGIKITNLKALHIKGGLIEVFKFLDSYGPW